MRNLFFLICCLFSINSFGSASIKGKAKAYKGEQIKLLFYTDMFCLQPILVSTKTIDQNGGFEFENIAETTLPISIKIKDYRTNLLIIPQTNYEIDIGEFDEKSAPPLSRKKYLPSKINVGDSININNEIGKLNVLIDSFEQRYYRNFLYGTAKPLVASFINSLYSKELYNTNTYYKNYVNAIAGSLKHKARSKMKETYEEYLDKPIEYQNIAYTYLVDDFYSKWLNRYNLTNENKAIYWSINEANLDSLHAILSTNDFLKNDTLREIIIIKELFRLAVNDKDVDATKIDKILAELYAKGKTKENRQIANHYLTRLRKLGIGDPAPLFALPNQHNNIINLSDFKGKYVYIDFWATWCKPCIKSMQMIRGLYESYNKNVAFISINIDERKQRFTKFLDANQYPWTMLYAGSDEKIKNDYDIVAIPLYYLIDPNGRLIQAPAYSPTGGIRRTFNELFDPKKNKEIEIWDWNKNPKKN